MNSNSVFHRKASPICNDNMTSIRSNFHSTSKPRIGIQRQQLPKKKQCWLASLAYITIGSIFFILIVSRQNSQSNNVRQSGNKNDCQKLNVLSPHKIAELEKLNLNGCGLTQIPTSIKYAINLKQLDVSNNPELKSLPDELKACKNLEILFVSSCQGIKKLPTVLGQMESITRLGWRSGSLTSVESDSIPPNIIHLILTNNKIQKMEDEALFEKLKNVRKLMISHNKLVKFGDARGSIRKMKNLELLRIAGNQLTSISDDLWELPKLTWLTISGNPLMDEIHIESKVPWIGIHDLVSTGNFLGEGASGKVASYEWKEKTVAVKIIHGVTSDGRAEDELKVYGAVGSDGLEHRVVGCVALLNGDRKGAVMQQLPSNLIDLALPPTINEVTEDRWDNWDADTTFSASFVLNVLFDLSRALKFLHYDAGVAHGDIYAHNMKVNKDTGNVFLLDFGASFFTQVHKTKAERLEVRAFGILVGELFSKLDSSEVSLANELQSLKLKCIDAAVEKRLSFDEIENQIIRLKKSYEI